MFPSIHQGHTRRTLGAAGVSSTGAGSPCSKYRARLSRFTSQPRRHLRTESYRLCTGGGCNRAIGRKAGGLFDRGHVGQTGIANALAHGQCSFPSSNRLSTVTPKAEATRRTEFALQLFPPRNAVIVAPGNSGPLGQVCNAHILPGHFSDQFYTVDSHTIKLPFIFICFILT